MNGFAKIATLAVFIMVMATVGTPSPARAADVPALTVSKIQPVEGDAVVVERVVGGKDYVDDRWRLVMDIWVQNDGPGSLHLTAVTIRYDAGGIPPFVGLGQDLEIVSGEDGKVLVPEDRLHQFPLPDEVTVALFFAEHNDPFEITVPLAAYANQPAPMGSYRFPGKREDLDALPYDDCYWSTAEDQGTFEGHHRVSKTQRFAYDLGVRCWSEEDGAWSRLHPGTDGSQNDDWLVYGMPLYAMADGVVYACTRDQPDNDVGQSGPDGNGLAIRHGVDEYVNYAHMQWDSIPEEICYEGATVEAGQHIGNAGNSGSSGNPHLHTQAQRGVTGVEPHDGRPQLFHNIRALEVGPDWNWFSPADDLPWHTTNGAAPGAFMLIDPLDFDDVPGAGLDGGSLTIAPRDPVGIVEAATPAAERRDDESAASSPSAIVARPAESTPEAPPSAEGDSPGAEPEFVDPVIITGIGPTATGGFQLGPGRYRVTATAEFTKSGPGFIVDVLSPDGTEENLINEIVLEPGPRTLSVFYLAPASGEYFLVVSNTDQPWTVMFERL